MKKIILLLLIFLLSGCTAKYEITLSDDMSVKENYSILNNAGYYDMLGNIDDAYKKVVDAGMKEVGYINYDYFKQNDLYGVKGSNIYNSLVEFKEYSKMYKKLYDDIEINRDGSVVRINSIGDLILASSTSDTNEEKDQLLINEFVISMKIPFNVISSNADKFDEQNNIYYWNIDNSTTSEKSIQIEFDTDKKFLSITTIISKLDYTFILIVVIILIGLVVYNNIKRKNKENNRI